MKWSNLSYNVLRDCSLKVSVMQQRRKVSRNTVHVTTITRLPKTTLLTTRDAISSLFDDFDLMRHSMDNADELI